MYESITFQMIFGKKKYFYDFQNYIKANLADSTITRMLDRFRNWIIVDENTSRKIKRFGPILLLIGFIGYLFFGATCFWFFEKSQATRAYRQHFLHLAVNR